MVQQRTPRQSWIRTLSKLSVAAMMIGIVGCSEPPMFHRNPVAVLPMNSLERGWFVDLQLKNDYIANVDVRDKLVYIYLQSKQVIAFDRKSGMLKMALKVHDPSKALRPLVELKNHLVFPNATTLEVYDAQGAFEKSIDLPQPLRSNAAGANSTIYFGSVGPHGGLVEAYDVEQPYAPQKWEYLTRDAGAVMSGIASYANVVYSASVDGEIDAVTTERAQLWDTEHGEFKTGPVDADLVVDETGLYVASKDTKLSCINRATGKLKWQYFAGLPLGDSPVTSSDTVYQYVPTRGLAAIDKLTGAFNRVPRWIHPTATKFLAQDEKYAYLADPRPIDEDGHIGYAIIAVDKQTMTLAFESNHKDFSVLGTNRHDSLIYGGFPDGKFYAIQPVIKAGQIGELVMVPVRDSIASAK